MPSYETESLVLKSYNLAEADRIVVFFTRDHGVVRGVAKGAKRLKSRFGSTLEPFSTVQLSYFQKDDRELVSIQNIELVRSVFGRAGEAEFLHTYAYIAELLLSFTPPHDPNETLYRMINACIAAGEGNEGSLASIRLYFEVWLLRLGGYLPNWDRCGECRREIGGMAEVFLAPDFHLLCEVCRGTRRFTGIEPTHRQIFQNVQKLGPSEFNGSAAEMRESVDELSLVMRRIITQVLGKEVPIGSFRTASVSNG